MSVPSSGWLAEANNTLQDPESAPLPVSDLFSYGDGAQGEYDNEDLSGFIRASQFGGTGFVFKSGAIGSSFGFIVEVERTDAYAIILIDTLDPVDVEFNTPDEEPAVPVETPEHNEGITPESFDSCCCVEDYWLYNGEYTYDGTRFAGGID